MWVSTSFDPSINLDLTRKDRRITMQEKLFYTENLIIEKKI